MSAVEEGLHALANGQSAAFASHLDNDEDEGEHNKEEEEQEEEEGHAGAGALDGTPAGSTSASATPCSSRVFQPKKASLNAIPFPLARVKRLIKNEDETRVSAEATNVIAKGVPPPRKISRTIENTREEDETIAQPDDEELHAEDAADEFSAHFNHEITPQLLITSSRWCSTTTIKFIAELLRVLPNAHYYKRGSYEIKQIVKYAKNRDFTAIIIVHDNRKEPNGMLVISLPEGPTAHFKISNLVLSKKIKGHGKPTRHLPELILNNFTTRVGHRVGRMLASLFPQQPNFQGRRVVTFHNQRDFIFFRHHRYIFEEKEAKDRATKGQSKLKGASKESGTNGKKPHKGLVIARLQECGPRFTLKLLSLQHGTFDSKFGEYEWVHKADMDTSRRRFFM